MHGTGRGSPDRRLRGIAAVLLGIGCAGQPVRAQDDGLASYPTSLSGTWMREESSCGGGAEVVNVQHQGTHISAQPADGSACFTSEQVTWTGMAGLLEAGLLREHGYAPAQFVVRRPFAGQEFGFARLYVEGPNLIRVEVERPGPARFVLRRNGPPPAAVSAAPWKERAEAIRAAPQPPGSAPNQAITCAYADMYRESPETMKWAGLAALVSGSLGGALRNPEISLPFEWDEALMRSVAEGNRAVFQDLFWQHLVYAEQGLEGLRRLHQAGELPEAAWRGWSRIDEGSVWEGNLDLLYHEQSSVLPPMYDAHPVLWWLMNTWLYDAIQAAAGGPELVSPVPGHGDPFDESIADFDDRWEWVSESVWPAWQEFEEDPANHERLLSALAEACPR